MKRRVFVKKSSLMALSVSVFGVIHWNGKSFVGDTPTTSDILGPFYRPGAPMRSNIIPPNSKGIPLNFGGTVFKEDGKTPLSDVLVENWQCDENEYYDNTSDSYAFRGAVKTDKSGKYDFKTIVPIPYKADPNDESSWRPAHIHMRASIPGQQDLITQIYFKGGKYVESDPWASAPQAVNRILPMGKNPAGENVVTFDVVMAKEFALDPLAFKRITGLYRMDKNVFEFRKSDDLLFVKQNGLFRASLKYVGQNTFAQEIEKTKVTFELLANGGTKATVEFRGKTISGERYLKYED
jgi:protocatechuate 3,4-dioxygenase beta subunit